ncbi:DUF4189 domain-containing protein [Pseudoxanthomonas sacheonensis]|uniref:DUF4189 domain-containing protein n=1 Tax=Pseudoxanthomonas sacheonensis TaxID=443615 RepID=UPI0013D6DDB3|nr:DUF4189 domain-containing protein [Pseudoxanthomonas sacheonensis]KAF1707042.1 hypothetical protein CSC73_13495 [Pseudoxanthomonas sacheonensis]
MKSKWLLMLGLLSISGFAWAEGGCPSGMIPYSGTDLSSCGPIPAGYYGNNNDNNSASQAYRPSVRWATTWGAIATDGIKGSLGTAVRMPSKEEAKRTALSQCRANGGLNCEVDLEYYNQCAVMVVGDKGYNTARAATIEKATQLGEKTCSSTDTNCRVYYADCSLAKRIQ